MRMDHFIWMMAGGHIFSEHSGLSPKKKERLRNVGPFQYALHWMYGVSEPILLRIVDRLVSSKFLTKTKTGKFMLKAIGYTSRYLPHGVIVTTEAAENWIDFITGTEGPNGARIAVGPCVCQHALNRWKEPCRKDITILYGADIYYNLNMGYELISAEEAKSILRECHQAGLIHALEFCFQSGRWNFVICNCDTEICVPARFYLYTGIFQYQGPEIVLHEVEKCLGPEACGKCLDRCVYDANKVENGAIVFNAHKCMGCGLCVTTCKGGARRMARRKGYAHDNQIPSDVLLGDSRP